MTISAAKRAERIALAASEAKKAYSHLTEKQISVIATRFATEWPGGENAVFAPGECLSNIRSYAVNSPDLFLEAPSVALVKECLLQGVADPQARMALSRDIDRMTADERLEAIPAGFKPQERSPDESQRARMPSGFLSETEEIEHVAYKLGMTGLEFRRMPASRQLDYLKAWRAQQPPPPRTPTLDDLQARANAAGKPLTSLEQVRSPQERIRLHRELQDLAAFKSSPQNKG